MTTRTMQVLTAGGCTLALFLAGCETGGDATERTSSPRPRRAEDFAGRRIETADLATVQTVAERVFRSYFRIDAGASSAVDMVAFPTDVAQHETEPGGGADTIAAAPGGPRPKETVGDMVGVAPRRYRRVAELRLTSAAGAVTAQVRVMLQRLTTAEQIAFARQRGDDRPNDTAIDHMGPESPSSREEWRDYRRDRVMEREILNAIQAGLAATQPAAGA